MSHMYVPTRTHVHGYTLTNLHIYIRNMSNSFQLFIDTEREGREGKERESEREITCVRVSKRAKAREIERERE